jgi:hypothetical protein
MQWRQTFLASLERELTRLYMCPEMATFLKETIDRVLDGRIISCTGKFQDIAASQTRIGWMALFRGFWSHKWLEAHLAHVAAAPLRDQADQAKRGKHQDRRLHKVSSFIMRQCHKLWKQRNNERHGVTPAEKSAALRITAKRELDQLYNQRDDCAPRHRPLFSPPSWNISANLSAKSEIGSPCTRPSSGSAVNVTAKPNIPRLPVHRTHSNVVA